MSIAGIFVAPASSQPMESRRSAVCVKGVGIAGDRYATHTGSYSLFRASRRMPDAREPGRQLTVLSADSVEAALDAAGVQASASLGDLRRNILIRGISAQQLLNAIGSELTLGADVRVFLHRHCVPCMYNEKYTGRPGQMEAIWDVSGVSCEVVAGGEIRIGDRVRAVPNSAAPDRLDPGAHAPGYYTRPSQRSAATARAAREHSRATVRALKDIDPQGIRRVADAYRSVGLTFAAAEEDAQRGGLRRRPSEALLEDAGATLRAARRLGANAPMLLISALALALALGVAIHTTPRAACALGLAVASMYVTRRARGPAA